ncbi:MAG: CopG family transcriptional regulator [Candidatus Thermoplasmatota archaeon]|nr:CopG family transcriptional regulator [Candidatus Thermoplasmatota archaeon]
MRIYTTVSAKISQEDREKLRELGLNPTEIIRKAVQEEIRKASNKALIEKMKRMTPVISKLNLDEIVSDIREDRER